MTTLLLWLALGLVGWCVCSLVVGLVLGRMFAAADRHAEVAPERERPELDRPVHVSRATW